MATTATALRSAFCGVPVAAAAAAARDGSVSRGRSSSVSPRAVATPALDKDMLRREHVEQARLRKQQHPGSTISLESLITKLEGKARLAARAAAEKVLTMRGSSDKQATAAAAAPRPWVSPVLLADQQKKMRAWWADHLHHTASVAEAVLPDEEESGADEDSMDRVHLAPPRYVGPLDNKAMTSRNIFRHVYNPTSDPTGN